MSNLRDIARGVYERIGGKIPEDFIYAHLHHESTGGTSQLARENYNYSGVTQVEPNSSPQPDGANYYKEFANDEEFMDFQAHTYKLYAEDGVFLAETIDDFALALKRGSYYGDTTTNYTAGLRGALGLEPSEIAHDPVSNFFSKTDVTANGIPKQYERELEKLKVAQLIASMDSSNTPQEVSFLDKFTNNINRNPLVGLGRIVQLQNEHPTDNTVYKLTQDDVDYVHNNLPFDKVARKFVLDNAYSREQLEALVRLKKEDIELSERVDGSVMGMNTLGSLAGLVAGEVVNPINYIGLGLVNKGNMLLRMGKMAMINATINGVDSRVRERLSGYEDDLKSSLIIGGIAGAGIGALSRVSEKLLERGIANATLNNADNLSSKTKKLVDGSKRVADGLTDIHQEGIVKQATKNADTIADVVIDTERVAHTVLQDGIQLAKGLPTSDIVPIMREGIEGMHNIFKGFVDDTFKTTSHTLSKLMDNKSVYVISQKEFGKLGNMMALNIPENVKAFVYNGAVILNKESIEGMTNGQIKGLLRHELGVHSLPPDTRNKLLEFVGENLKNPKGIWLEARNRVIANTPKGTKVDLEEVLGYFAEVAREWGVKGEQSRFVSAFRSVLKTDSRLTNSNILDLIDSNVSSIATSPEELYRFLDDGTAVINNNIKMSATNILNPSHAQKLTEIAPEVTKNNKAWEALSKGAEDSFLFRTPFGAFIHSKSATMRKYANTLLEDARHRVTEGVNALSAETLKKHINEQIDVHKVQLNQEFGEYMTKNHLSNFHSVKTRQNVWEQIVRYHDSVHAGNSLNFEVDPAIKSMSNHLKNLEETEIKLAKKYGYLPEDRDLASKGTRRVVDSNKLKDLILGYNTVNGVDGTKLLTQDLEEYAKQAMHKRLPSNIQQVKDKIHLNNLKAQTEYEKNLNLFKEGKLPVEPKKPILEEYTPEALKKHINETAKDWAYGIVNQNTSNFSELAKGDSVLDFMKHRVDLDTSHVAIVNGGEFSFDDMLRSYDFDAILNRTQERWAGEIALHHSLKSQDDLIFTHLDGDTKTLTNTVDKTRKVIEKEFEQLMVLKQVSRAEAERSLEIFDMTVRKIAGTDTSREAMTIADVATNMLLKLSYAERGGLFGVNNIAEIVSSFGYLGFRMVHSLFPFVSKPFGSNVDTALVKLFGDDIQRLNWYKGTLIQSKAGRALDPLSKNSTAVEAVDNFLNMAGALTSSVSRLPSLTHRMIKDAHGFAYLDLLKFVDSTDEVVRSFSDIKLASIGIKDSKVFKQALQDYIVRGSDGTIKNLDLDKMFANDIGLFHQVRSSIDTITKKAFNINTIGNRNILQDKNNLWKLFFQFKSFTNMAMNSQFMAKLESRELDDALATAYSMAGAVATTSLITYATAYGKYGHDTQKREAFLKDKLSPKSLFAMSILRSPVLGSPLAHPADLVGAFANVDTFRTSVTDVGHYRNARTFDERLGRVLTQLPAVDTGINVGKAVLAPVSYYRKTLSQKDARDIMSIIPLSSVAQRLSIWQDMIKKMNLPKRTDKY